MQIEELSHFFRILIEDLLSATLLKFWILSH